MYGRKGLDELEVKLGRQRYLTGDRITETDWRLFTTLIRVDVVYHGHFKCNLKQLSDYDNLWSYTRELYQYPGVADTVNFDHIKQHYYVVTTPSTPMASYRPDLSLIWNARPIVSSGN